MDSTARLKMVKYDPISAAILRGLHWLSVPFRIRYKLNSITSNCPAGRAPEYLIELCHIATPWLTFQPGATLGRRPRFSSWSLDIGRNDPGRSFSVSSPQLWNLLPADIRLLHNEHQRFRKRLKTHYMQQSMLRHWGSMSTVWTLLQLLLLLEVVLRSQYH